MENYSAVPKTGGIMYKRNSTYKSSFYFFNHFAGICTSGMTKNSNVFKDSAYTSMLVWNVEPWKILYKFDVARRPKYKT